MAYILIAVLGSMMLAIQNIGCSFGLSSAMGETPSNFTMTALYYTLPRGNSRDIQSQKLFSSIIICLHPQFYVCLFSIELTGNLLHFFVLSVY